MTWDTPQSYIHHLCVLRWSLGDLTKYNCIALQSHEASTIFEMEYKRKGSLATPQKLQVTSHMNTNAQQLSLNPAGQYCILYNNPKSADTHITLPQVLRLLLQSLTLLSNPQKGWFSGLMVMEIFHYTSKLVSAHHSLTSPSVKICLHLHKVCISHSSSSSFCLHVEPKCCPSLQVLTAA